MGVKKKKGGEGFRQTTHVKVRRHILSGNKGPELKIKKDRDALACTFMCFEATYVRNLRHKRQPVNKNVHFHTSTAG